MKSTMLVRFELYPPEIYCDEHDVHTSKYVHEISSTQCDQTAALSQTERPAADVSALIVQHGHESKSSHAPTLKV